MDIFIKESGNILRLLLSEVESDDASVISHIIRRNLFSSDFPNTPMIQINFTPFPELTTKHFKLRQVSTGDENEIFALRSDDYVNQYLDRPKANSLDDARNFIGKITDGIAKNESIFWVVTPKSEMKFLGTICLWKISKEEAKAEIGYELLPENHGKGIMQEVIPKVLQFGFEEMKLLTVEAELSPRNLKSVRLLEQNNFRLRSIDPENPDSVVYVRRSFA